MRRNTYLFQLRAERLLAQNMLAGFNCLDGVLCMDGGDGGDADSLKALVLQHLVVIGVDLDTPWLEILLCPHNLILSRCECCYELSLGRAVKKVVCVAGAHAAKA